MVQTRQPTKQDHSVIRQLLSAGARIPPIAVIKNLPKTTDNCSSNTENLKNTNLAEALNFTKDITIEIIQVDDKDNGDDFNDIDLSSSSELFPEIGLPLPDLHDIDDMVTNETIQSPDYCKSVVSSVQIPTTPECVDSVMSCSFPKSDEALFSFLGKRDSVTSPCLATPPGNQEFELQRRMSPMQICSSSDSEAASSPPPAQSQSVTSTPTETTASSTIKSLLSRPPMKTSIPSDFTFTTNTSSAPTPTSSGTNSISPPVQMIPTTVDQPTPVIPLSVLAMGDDEAAVEAQRQLKELDGQQEVSLSPDVSSDEEEEMQEEPVIPVRRRWIKKASSVSGTKQKRERKASSVSSEQDIDMDDLDSEYGDDGEKLERRRLNNRVAAQRCRQRKREYHLSLTKEIQQWECNNTALKYDIHKLQKELLELQQVLQQHQAECTVDPADLASAASVKKSKKKSKKRSKSHKQKR